MSGPGIRSGRSSWKSGAHSPDRSIGPRAPPCAKRGGTPASAMAMTNAIRFFVSVFIGPPAQMLYQIAPARNVIIRLQYTTPIHKAIDTAATIFALADVLSPAPTPSTWRFSPVDKYRTSLRPTSTRHTIFAANAMLTGGPSEFA